MHRSDAHAKPYTFAHAKPYTFAHAKPYSFAHGHSNPCGADAHTDAGWSDTYANANSDASGWS